MKRLSGVGLTNIYLENGYQVHGVGDESATSYEKLDDLYHAIGRSIALRCRVLSGTQLRFLRKRLELNQAELGRLVGKSAQAVAKWEKERLDVPTAEGKLVKVLWAVRCSPADLMAIVQDVVSGTEAMPPNSLTFRYFGEKWRDIELAEQPSQVGEQVREKAPTSIVHMRYVPLSGAVPAIRARASATARGSVVGVGESLPRVIGAIGSRPLPH